MTIETLHTAAELLAVGPEWEQLVENASEPNVFYERWMLVPGVRHFVSERPLFVFVASDETGELIGFFPLIRRYGYRRIPVHYLTMWQHPHSVLSTPLLRAGREDEAIGLFLDWVDSSEESGSVVEFGQVGVDGPVGEALLRRIPAGARSFDTVPYQRALLHSSLPPEEYLSKALSGKRRKEYRRLENRLAEQGHLEVAALGPNDDVEVWLKDFLELEQRGWKGKAGTALGVRENETLYFQEIVRGAFRQDKLMMLKMMLNREPIAMKCSFCSGVGSFSLKIAYDETWSRYSPGLLLELHNISLFLNEKRVAWMDSCAIPDHFMINRLWMERRSLSQISFSTNRRSSKMLLSGIVHLKKFYRSCKRSKINDQPNLHH